VNYQIQLSFVIIAPNGDKKPAKATIDVPAESFEEAGLLLIENLLPGSTDSFLPKRRTSRWFGWFR
jgi:hypothetical protein